MARVHSPGWINRLVRRLFGAPFENLPPEFGNTVPPELRVFEAEAEEAQHTEQSERVGRLARHGRSSPARQDESLKRQ
jgi:hypothetical protein